MDRCHLQPAELVLETFPPELEQKLMRECHFQEILLANRERFGDSRLAKKYLFPNKLEDFLLKLVIPFLRIGHCPRGRYLQVFSLIFSKAAKYFL